MKKLLSLLLCAAMVSPITAFADSSKYNEVSLNTQSAVISSGAAIDIENSKGASVPVNFDAKKGDNITLYITINSSSSVAGLLGNLEFNTNYLDCTDFEFDFIFDGSFVNRISRGFMYYSVLFGANGAYLTNNTDVLAFNFTVRQDISSIDNYLMFTTHEYYDVDLNELSYNEIGYRIVSAKDNTDTDTSTDTDSATDIDTSTDTDSATDTDTSTDTDSATDTDTSTDTDNVTDTDTSTNTDNVTDTDTSTNTDNTTDTDTATDTNTDTDNNPEPLLQFGDVNGDGSIDSFDAVQILRFSIGITQPSDLEKLLADINDDGSVDSFDAVAILRYSINIIDNPKIGEFYYAN